jgi:hypothetical protein
LTIASWLPPKLTLAPGIFCLADFALIEDFAAGALFLDFLDAPLADGSADESPSVALPCTS